MSKCRPSQVENWGQRWDITSRGYYFGGSARFEWDMATDIGTYQGGIIGRHIRQSHFLAQRTNVMLWGCTPMRWIKGTK